MAARFALILLALPFAYASVGHDHSHSHAKRSALPAAWYQPRDHPTRALFSRGAPTDGTTYPQVGTPTWSSGFPTWTPDPNQVPKAWTDALAAAVSAGKIPDIPVATSIGGNNPTYPKGNDPNGATVCSSTYKCRAEGDIWDAPDGQLAHSFDDGPLPSTAKLVQFLVSQNQKTTHFMIGVNILNNPAEFSMAFDNGHDIAVHTYTHPYMTTQTNQQVLAELGWTMQLIHNSTGGRVPKFWRPPYGDSDNRVRAIAREVFGLTTIIWNQDTEDWNIGNPGGPTLPQVEADLTKWITGPKTPGLIILEHELNDNTVGAFINAYPLMVSQGWNLVPVTQINGSSPYTNSPSSTGAVTVAGILGGGSEGGSSSSSPSSSPSSTSSKSGSTSTTRSGSGSTASAGSAAASTTPQSNAGFRMASVSGWGCAIVVVALHWISL